MTTSSPPKRILTLGMPSDYPPEFREISAACDFAIAASPTGETKVVKDRQGIVPRPPTVGELMSCQVVLPQDVERILGGGIQSNGQRPAPLFAEGDRVTPGPDSVLTDLHGEVGTVEARRFCRSCGRWHYAVEFDRAGANMMEANMRPADEVESSAQHASSRDGEPAAIEAPQPDGWQGTEPAEGTRRRTILDTITAEPGVAMTPLDLADRIESALLRATIAEEAEELPDEVAAVVEEALTDDVEDTHGFSGAFDVLVGPDGAHVSIDSLIRVLGQLGDEAEEEYDRAQPEEGRPTVTDLFDLLRDFLPRRRG